MSTEKKPKPKSAKSISEQMPANNPAPAIEAEPRRDAIQWQEQAAFSITFNHANTANGQTIWQTHALHEETGDEHAWASIPDAELIAWIREHAKLPIDASAPKLSVEPAPEILATQTADTSAKASPLDPAQTAALEQAPALDQSSNLRLQISDLMVEELPSERQIGGQHNKDVMRSVVSFKLAGMGAYLATANAERYTIQIIASNLASNHADVLATSQGQLQPEPLAYTETLNFDLPPLGSYQLLATVVLADSGVAAVALGPILTVVP